MGFKSHSQIQAETRKPIAEICTQYEMDSKIREFNITNLLGENVEELKEWIYSHYVPNSSLWAGGVYVKNPLKKSIIINLK